MFELVPPVPYIYKAKIVNIVDGDTFDAVIDVGFKMTTKQRLRLLGVNTAETNSKDEAQRALAIAAKEFGIANLLNKDVILSTAKSDAFGRYLASVIFDGSKDYATVLLNEKLAIPYKG
jgi:micrococcal nuclease